MNLLCASRDVYILQHLALKADRSKKQVLVLGAFHSWNIIQLLSDYGAKCPLIMVPNNTR
jgi:hypothetical protein